MKATRTTRLGHRALLGWLFLAGFVALMVLGTAGLDLAGISYPQNWLFRIPALVAYLLLVTIAYRKQEAPPLPNQKPHFCLFPKFRMTPKASQAMLKSTDPFAELGDRLRDSGFDLDKRLENMIRFTRGSLLGDSSIEIAKVNLTFTLPLVPNMDVLIEYGSMFVAFDTGDLWTFSTELRRRLES